MPSKQRKPQVKTSSKQSNPGILTKYRLAIFVVLFAFVGMLFLFQSKAAQWTCQPREPRVRISALYAWNSDGLWATPGMPRNFPMGIVNNDCKQQTYTVSVQVPDGFTATLDKTEVTLDAYGSSKLIPSTTVNLNVSSQSSIADGDYPIIVTITSTTDPLMTASDTSYYKVYSSDTAAPRFGITNPFGTIKASKRTNVIANVYDDHILKLVEFYIDGRLVYSHDCTEETLYFCQPYFVWDSTKAVGDHTVLYKATDLFNNTSSTSVNFTVTR